MYVRPEDLANLCAIYEELRVNKLHKNDLEKYFQISKPIDCDICPSIVLSDAVKCDLVKVSDNICIITDRGGRLAKRQKQCSNIVSDQAKEYLIKKVYLDITNRGMDCASFLLRFQVDTVLGTFVFNRSEQEQKEDSQWIKLFERLGFLQIDSRLIMVDLQYLGLFNDFLRQIREEKPQETDADLAEREVIGAIAEKCAIQYEIQRLSKLGYKELCPLIQQVSLVDKSAGYDVLSFCGIDRNPDDRIHIEVKGTKKRGIEFIWSKNERRVANTDKKKYWIYIYTQVDIENETAKGPIRLNDPIRTLKIKGYTLEPIDVKVSKLS